MINKEKNFVSAVVYMHNSEKVIKGFIEDLISVLSENFEKSEIICVNDSSSDNTVKEVKEISKNSSGVSVSVLNMSYFHGLEVAMNAGVDLSIGDFVFEFDKPERDYELDEIMKVYRKSLEGYDIVGAMPDKKQRFTSRFFYKILEKNSRAKYKLFSESFRILSRRVINRIDSMNKSVPYRKIAYANSGLKVTSVKYSVIETSKVKEGRIEKKYRRALATDTLMMFTDIGYNFSIFMTGVMMAVGIFMAVYSIFIYFMADAIEGWTTTILFLSMVSFGLFAVLSVVIKYLQIIVNQTFRRKKYNFESIEKLTK